MTDLSVHNLLGHYCPVCGYMLDEPAWVDGIPTWGEICSSCGIEFGVDDAIPEFMDVYKDWRKTWIQNGMKWWGSRDRPPNWNPREQLKNIPKEFLGPDESRFFEKLADLKSTTEPKFLSSYISEIKRYTMLYDKKENFLGIYDQKGNIVAFYQPSEEKLKAQNFKNLEEWWSWIIGKKDDSLNTGNTCPVCGTNPFSPWYKLDFVPWIKGEASQQKCPTCNTHFGYDDASLSTPGVLRNWYNLRQKWIRDGLARKAVNWPPFELVKNIPKEFLGPDEKY